VGLRLTLETTLIHSSSSGSIIKPEYITHDPSLVPPFTHLYGTRLPDKNENWTKPI